VLFAPWQEVLELTNKLEEVFERINSFELSNLHNVGELLVQRFSTLGEQSSSSRLCLPRVLLAQVVGLSGRVLQCIMATRLDSRRLKQRCPRLCSASCLSSREEVHLLVPQQMAGFGQWHPCNSVPGSGDEMPRGFLQRGWDFWPSIESDSWPKKHFRDKSFTLSEEWHAATCHYGSAS
jgi:hypothetical protein